MRRLPLNDAAKDVASRGRPPLTWRRSVLIEGDASEGGQIVTTTLPRAWPSSR